MNPIELILSGFGVVNFSAAAAMVNSVPNDVVAIDAALVPYIADVAMRSSCASRIVIERTRMVTPAVIVPPPPIVGAALLPVTLPAAPALAWALPGGALPPPVVPPTLPVATHTPWWVWLMAFVIGSVVIATFVLVWVGIKTQATTSETSNMLATVQTNIEGSIVDDGKDTRKVVTDSKDEVIKKVSDEAKDTRKVVTDSKDEVIKKVSDEAKDTRKAMLDARRNLNKTILAAAAGKATKADLDAAEQKLSKAIKGIEITVKVK